MLKVGNAFNQQQYLTKLYIYYYIFLSEIF